jgi:hypothetical protein
VPRAGSAAPTDDRSPLVQERARDLADVLRRRGIQEPAAHLGRPAGVRPGDDRRFGRERRDRSDHAEHLRRALATVHAERIDAEVEQASRDHLGRVAEQRPIVAGERRAREERQPGRRVARGAHGLLQLAQVGLGLDHEDVGAGLRQGRRLLAVGVESLGRVDPAVRLQPDPERADRSADELGLGSAGAFDTRRADRRHAVGEAVAFEPVPVRTERVRQDELRAGSDERGMDRGHAGGVAFVQRLHTRVQCDAGVDQRRAHPAVGDQRRVGPLVQGGGVHQVPAALTGPARSERGATT